MSKPDWISDRRLYLDANGNVVESDNPAKLTLLVAKGGALPFEVAKRYRLIAGETAASPAAEVAARLMSEPVVIATSFGSTAETEAPIVFETTANAQSEPNTVEQSAPPVQPAPSKPKGKKK